MFTLPCHTAVFSFHMTFGWCPRARDSLGLQSVWYSCSVSTLRLYHYKISIQVHCLKRIYIKYQMATQVGAADYIALAQHYHTVFITDIPIMSMRMIDKVRDDLFLPLCTLFEAFKCLNPQIDSSHSSVRFSESNGLQIFLWCLTLNQSTLDFDHIIYFAKIAQFCAFLHRENSQVTQRGLFYFFQARRFITLVDELYNHHCRLICTAEGPPDDLFLGTMDGSIFDIERLVILLSLVPLSQMSMLHVVLWYILMKLILKDWIITSWYSDLLIKSSTRSTQINYASWESTNHYHELIHTWLLLCSSLQFETEAEGGRLRRDVTAEGSVAPVGGTRSERTSIQSIFSGREEAFAFRRAVRYLFHFLLTFRSQLAALCFQEDPSLRSTRAETRWQAPLEEFQWFMQFQNL